MASEKMKIALEKIHEANRLFKEEWDSNKEDYRAAGCYKALNAVSNVISEDDDKEKDEDYTFSRLIEAVSWLADHYHVTFGEALRIGGARER